MPLYDAHLGGFSFYNLCQENRTDNNSLVLKLDELFAKYSTVPIQYLGIPSDGSRSLLDWRREPLFKN